MEFSVKPRIGRPRGKELLDEVEGVPVTSAMRNELRRLKNQGLRTHDMVRDFLDDLIRRANDGKIEGFKVDKDAS